MILNIPKENVIKIETKEEEKTNKKVEILAKTNKLNKMKNAKLKIRAMNKKSLKD